MAKLTLTDVASGYASTTAVNANNALIEAAFENTLSRDGTSPNQMGANLDMNGYLILNQANPVAISGFEWNGDWATATVYAVGDIVYESSTGAAYICVVAHTSGTFATDLAAVKWQVFASASLPPQTAQAAKFLQTNGTAASWEVPEASEVSFTPSGTGAVATTVEAKLRQLPQASNYSTNADFLAAVAALETSGWFPSAGQSITRLPDRVFIGEAAARHAGETSPDTGTSWLSSAAQGPHYLLANAQLLSMTAIRRYAMVAAAKTSLTAGAGSAIGLGVALIADGSTGGHGAIIEVQHESASYPTWGLEIAHKNSAANVISTPYTNPTGTSRGLMLVGGGDNSFGPTAANPSSVGITFSTNNGKGWNTGIEFRSGSIATGEAISLANTYSLNWYETTGTVSAAIQGSNNTAGSKITLRFQSGGVTVNNNSGASAFFVATTPTDVNRVQVTAGAAGVPPQVSAAGSDTNIDLRLNAQGTGYIRFGTWTSNVDAAVNGYVTIKDAGGTLRKLATIA